MNVFSSLFGALDDVLGAYINESVVEMTAFVSGPIAILGTISFVAMGIIMLRGISEIPVAQFIQTSALLALVFSVAGSAGHYNTYLADHIRRLPDELLSIFAGIGVGDEQEVGAVFDRIGDQAMTGISAIWSAGGFTDPGPSLFAAILFVIFLIFGVAATIALATVKIGLSLVVATGPIMIVGLLFSSTREYFSKWLSYGIQFGFLAMFVGGVAGVTNEIVDVYIAALDDSAQNVDLVALMAPALMLLLLAKIFSDLPNMASSISGGIGLSIGDSAWRGMQGVINQAGGKYLSAWRDAARMRRTHGAYNLQDNLAALRREGVKRAIYGRDAISESGKDIATLHSNSGMRGVHKAREGASAVAGETKDNYVEEARAHVEARKRRLSGEV